MIDKVSYMSGGAGLLPSTVWHGFQPTSRTAGCTSKIKNAAQVAGDCLRDRSLHVALAQESLARQAGGSPAKTSLQTVETYRYQVMINSGKYVKACLTHGYIKTHLTNWAMCRIAASSLLNMGENLPICPLQIIIPKY